MNGNARAGGLRLIRMLLIALCVGVVALSCATVLLWGSNQARSDQICDLVVNTHLDRVKRLTATLDYLHTPDGRERTGLNDYIRRASLPQLRGEVIKERESLPPTCTAGRRLPRIPK
jgi:hypothetical protein